MSEEIVGTEDIVTTDDIAIIDDTVPADEIASATESNRRGRPRPDAVIERDNGIFDIVAASAEPMTRKQIAEITGIKESHVYLSLLRLRNDGRLQFKRANGGHFWSLAINDTETAVETETTGEIVDEATFAE